MGIFRTITGVFVGFAAISALSGAALAQSIQAGPEITIEDPKGGVIVAGGEVEIKGVSRDEGLLNAVIAAGGEVTISVETAGDIIAAGGDVNVSGKSADLSLAGGSVFYSGEATGDASLAGGSVKISDGASIAGDLDVSAGEVTFDGYVGGDAMFAGGSVTIDGPIVGDVKINSQSIRLGPKTVIDGDVTFATIGSPVIDENAVINGETTYSDFVDGNHDHSIGQVVTGRLFGALFWFVALGASGALLMLIFPGWINRSMVAARDEPIGTFAFGVVALIATPIAAILSMVIVIGLPFGIFLLTIYGGLLFLSGIGAAFGIGHLLLDKSEDDTAKLTLFAVGLAIFSIASAVPFIGWIIGALAMSYGLGALGVGIVRSLRA